MISYDLAKELKLAGMPWERVAFFDMKGNDGQEENYPALTDLIKALGGLFYSLEQISPPDTWRAQSFATNRHDDRTRLIGGRTHGKTPEIALARLYLALYANNRVTA